VDLLEPKISVHMFHEWQEQTWGRDTAFLKTSTQKFLLKCQTFFPLSRSNKSLLKLLHCVTDLIRSVDAFAYDSNSPSKTLLAIDDVAWPKYVFAYDLHPHPPKVNSSGYTISSDYNTM
jgi:hypothetical protein